MGSAEELRALFEKRLAEGLPDGGFHPQDLERVKDDFYLTRIIERSKNDMVEASKSLWTILKWRKSVGASDITEDNIRMDYINKGVLFPHCRDTDGCKMIILKCKEYVKGQFEFEEVKKIFIYWLDRLEREERGNKVTLFLDLDGASLNNFDIDLIKYMINLFYYYPKFLNQIVIYQLPWILTAAFKIVKGLLPPEAVEIMKFATKETVLKQIVSPEQALTCWGGKDNYEFKFVPEKQIKKRVSFATTADRQNSCISTTSTMPVEDPTIPTHPTNTGEILSIQPSDKIAFKNEGEEMVGRIKISNLENGPLAFKIRTTGPEKFWVRPSSGLIAPKKTENILITILPGYQNTAGRERFLVMATLLDHIVDHKDLSIVWKNAMQRDIEEYRLKCHIIDDISKNHAVVGNKAINHVDNKPDLTEKAMNELKKEVKSLKDQVVIIKLYQCLSIVLGVITVFFGYLIYKEIHVERIKVEV